MPPVARVSDTEGVISEKTATRVLATIVCIIAIGVLFLLAMAIHDTKVQTKKMVAEFHSLPTSEQERAHVLVSEIASLQRGEYIRLQGSWKLLRVIDAVPGGGRAIVRCYGVKEERTFWEYSVLSEVAGVIKKTDPGYKDAVVEFFDH